MLIDPKLAELLESVGAITDEQRHELERLLNEHNAADWPDDAIPAPERD